MTKKIKHEFVKFIPSSLADNVLYISIDYTAVVHKCFCGCGSEVSTPLSPTDWKLIFDGKHISLYPSIGSWNLKCESHYWIKNSEVHWSNKWSKEQINAAQNYDVISKRKYYGATKSEDPLNWHAKPSARIFEILKKYIDRF